MSGRTQPPARPACCPTRRALEEARHPRPRPVPGTKGAEAGPSLGGSPGSGHKPLSELLDPPRALSLGPTLLPGLLSPQPSLSWDYFKSGGSASWGTPPSHVQTDQGPRAVWSSRGLATLARPRLSFGPRPPLPMSLGLCPRVVEKLFIPQASPTPRGRAPVPAAILPPLAGTLGASPGPDGSLALADSAWSPTKLDTNSGTFPCRDGDKEPVSAGRGSRPLALGPSFLLHRS